MMWKLLIMVACLASGVLARPDVSHLLKKTAGADKQKRQSFIGTSASLNGNGLILTEIKSGDAANGETLIPQIALLPLEDNQPSPFRRLEDRPGYDYQKPEFPLDVHPDSNLVSPVSTQAPEYLPPEGGEESSNVDKVVPPEVPTSTTTTITTTTTTTPAPVTYGVSTTTQQEFDNSDGYGYKKPEMMLSLNINEVIGEPSDINQLATTTEPTTTTTPKASLEYLPPKPRPELVVPKEPSFTSTSTGQPQTEPQTYPSSIVPSTTTTTQYQYPTEPPQQYPKQPEVSLYPDASGTVSTAVTQQTSTEVPSTSAPEYLPPDASGFQIIVRIDSEDNDTSTTTVGSGGSSTTTSFIQATELTEATTTLLPEVDNLLRQDGGQPSFSTQPEEQPTPTTTSTTTSSFVSSTTLLAGESTGIPRDETSSMVSLINQLQETNQIAAQGDFASEVRLGEEEVTTVDVGAPVSTTTSTTTTTVSSSTFTTPAVTEQPTERIDTETPSTEAPLPLESRLGSEEETTGLSLFDLLSPTTTVAAVATSELPAQNDTITTYRPSFTGQTVGDQTTVAAESRADETEIQSRIADPVDGYNYEAPENALAVPSSVVPSHTLEADGYHYKVPSVPFP